MNITTWEIGLLFIVAMAAVGVLVAELLRRTPPLPTAEQSVREPMPDFAPRPAKTWNLMMDGVMCSILKAESRPPRAVLTGRASFHWHVQRGDYLLLAWPGGTSTRYRVLGITRPGGDHYFIDAMFAPRVIAGRLA